MSPIKFFLILLFLLILPVFRWSELFTENFLGKSKTGEKNKEKHKSKNSLPIFITFLRLDWKIGFGRKVLVSVRKKRCQNSKKIIMKGLPKIPPLLRTTPENRLVYTINLIVNSRYFSEIHMDSHCFEGKNKKFVTPELIYYFALKLNNNKKPFIPEDRKGNWEFFAEEVPQISFYYQNRPYRLVWCWQDNGNFIGVITCTPIRKSKKI